MSKRIDDYNKKNYITVSFRLKKHEYILFKQYILDNKISVRKLILNTINEKG